VFILTVNYLKVNTYSQSIHTKNVYTLLWIVHAFYVQICDETYVIGASMYVLAIFYRMYGWFVFFVCVDSKLCSA
jgi:hypothetical protein